jgi:hypothetical protein
MQVVLNPIGQRLPAVWLLAVCVGVGAQVYVRVARFAAGGTESRCSKLCSTCYESDPATRQRILPPVAQYNATQCNSKHSFPEHYHGAAEHALADALALAIAEVLQVRAPMQERPPDDSGRNTCFE